MKKIIVFFIMFFEIFILLYSKEVIKEFTLTINLCLYALMPTMFFQIFFSNILINLDLEKIFSYKFCNFLNITKKELLIILISIFSGYPNNIRLLKDSENEYLNYSTNYINPLFLLVTVGTLYLNDIKLIIIIYISHILSNILLFYILKNRYKRNNINISKTKKLYSESLSVTIKTLSIIFSNLLLISLLVSFIKLLLPNNIFTSIIIGLLEFSRGIYEISFIKTSIFIKGFLILFIITFGSLSIHFQSICLNDKIKYIKYLIYRLFNVLLAFIIYSFLILMY